jgi:hypothetical protein
VSGSLAVAEHPRWAADGSRLYFLSRPKGTLLDVWGVDFDRTNGTAIGSPYRVTRFESLAFKISPMMSFWGFEVRGQWLFLSMRAKSGNLWTLDEVQ